MKKALLFFMAFLFFLSFITISGTVQAATGAAQTASAAEEVTIATTLKDQTATKADKLTFDLWAKDNEGNKISASYVTVTNNGKNVDINWDDLEKTSYTLQLDVGVNKISIRVEHDGTVYSKADTLTREEAADGDVIGTFTFSLEAFTVGLGYLIEPVQVDLIKGRNAAQELDALLTEYGFSYNSTGSLDSGFYLAAVLGGANQIYHTAPIIPDALKAALDGNYDEGSYSEAYGLGEFDFNYMSGWMYAVNNTFPNVGFADKYLQDGDVMRVQYTLAYGMDIGGADAMGGGYDNNFFGKVDKDGLMRKIAEINSDANKADYLSAPARQAAYDQAIAVLQQVDAAQAEIDGALSAIQAAE